MLQLHLRENKGKVKKLDKLAENIKSYKINKAVLYRITKDTIS